jgi:ribonuclease P protein component
MIAGGRIYRGRWLHVRIGASSAEDVLISVRRRYGPAVARNRVRRRIRAICQDLLAGPAQGSLMLISVGDRSSGCGYKALRRDLGEAFKALGLR